MSNGVPIVIKSCIVYGWTLCRPRVWWLLLKYKLCCRSTQFTYGTRMALGPRMVAIRRSDCPKQVASSCLLPWELPACQCQWSHHQLCSTALFLSEQPALALVLAASKYKYTNTQRHKYIRSWLRAYSRVAWLPLLSSSCLSQHWHLNLHLSLYQASIQRQKYTNTQIHIT